MRIITTHQNTDLDGLASVVAATLIAPDAVPVLPHVLNPNVKAFLSIHKDLFEFKAISDLDLDAVKGLIVVDTSQWRRLEGMEPLRDKREKGALRVWLWDHHDPESADIAADWKCQEPMGANITLMARSLKQAEIAVSPVQATLFLAGLHEDTGSLAFPSTRSEDAHAAAYFMEARADLNVMASLLRPAYGQKQKQVLFDMLKNENRLRLKGYAVSFVRLELGGHVRNLSLVVHMYREIANLDAAFGIFTLKAPDRCIVIGRSNVEALDMGVLMRGLGGGGHPGAGSAMLKGVRPEAVREMIQELIAGNQQASVQISDLMSFPVITIPPDMPMEAVHRFLREKGISGVPVAENGTLLGVISRRDFHRLKKRSAWKAPVKAFMRREVVTIAPGKSPMQAARLMVKHDVGRLPVIADDQIIGIVTRSDTMLYFYDLLPD